MNDVLLYLLPFASGVILFLVAWRVARTGIDEYYTHFVSRVSGELKESFRNESADFLFYGSFVLAIALGLLGGLFLHLPGAVAGLTLGVLAPWLAMRWMRRHRVQQFVYQLPDALRTIAATMRSGTNFTRALEMVAARYSAPLSQEFRLVLSEHRVGRDLEAALEDMRRRMPAQELSLFCTAVVISRSVGGNLADTLDSLATNLYEKAQIEQKIKALTAMGRAQGWVVGLLPVFIGFVLYLQQPDEMSQLFTTMHGWIVISILATAMGLAVWMIRRIVNIDV